MSDETISDHMNTQLLLISGESGSGKSASLKDIPNQEKWLYANCEAGKRLPFKNNFRTLNITDPYQVFEVFDYAEENPDEVDGIIIDTVTFLMDMLETQYVISAPNTQKAWGEYAQFFKRLMQQRVARLEKPVIILGHTRAELDETAMEMKVAVPVKGSLKNNGIEAYFSTVVSTKKIPLKKLEKFQSKLLNVTEDEEDLGFKYVFQTRLTKETTGERIRSPMGLFSRAETYSDNNAWMILQRLRDFYGS